MGGARFNVEEGRDANFTVNLETRFCDCNKWQVTGIPCKYAARCILNRKHQITEYCDPFYSVEKYKSLYDHVISPIPSPIMWKLRDLPLLDPPPHTKKGRQTLFAKKDGVNNLQQSYWFWNSKV